MRVKVRAVIVDGSRLLVVPERRSGSHSHFSLPGGRIGQRESVTDALVREVREETGLEVAPQGLLYVAEVAPPHGTPELNLIFLVVPIGEPNLNGLQFVDLADRDHPLILPPIVAEIGYDLHRGWAGTPRWLGNLWDGSLNRRRRDSPR